MVKASAKISYDMSNAVRMREQLKAINRIEISAGIHKEEGAQIVSDSGFRLVDVAVQNNYGNEYTVKATRSFKAKNGQFYHLKAGTVIKIPATHFVTRLIKDARLRRYIVDTVHANVKIMLQDNQTRARIEHLAGGVVNTKPYTKGLTDATKAVKHIGSTMRDLIKAGIQDNIFQPNQPMTIEIKGKDHRLSDTGRLEKEIKYKSKKTRAQG